MDTGLHQTLYLRAFQQRGWMGLGVGQKLGRTNVRSAEGMLRQHRRPTIRPLPQGGLRVKYAAYGRQIFAGCAAKRRRNVIPGSLSIPPDMTTISCLRRRLAVNSDLYDRCISRPLRPT